MNQPPTWNEDGAPQRLRAAGLRPTIARLGVLQVLQDVAPRRLDAEGVFRELLRRGLSGSQGTVYRALKELADHGLALYEWRNGLSGGKAAYGLRPPEAQAHGASIVCSECGCSTQIDDPALQAQLRQLAQRQGLALSEQPLTILAVCAQCARKAGTRH